MISLLSILIGRWVIVGIFMGILITAACYNTRDPHICRTLSGKYMKVQNTSPNNRLLIITGLLLFIFIITSVIMYVCTH